MEKQRLADPIIKEKKYDTNIISIFLSNTVQLTDPSVMKYDCAAFLEIKMEFVSCN